MRKNQLSLAIVIVLFLLSDDLIAQHKKTGNEPAPSIESPMVTNTKGLTKYPGYFEFYYSDKDDKLLIVIDKLNTEFLYVESMTAAIGSNDIGLDRNQLGKERVVKFERRGSKVLLIEPNSFYRAITNNAAEAKAVEESFAQSVLFGFKIVAEDADGRILVDATDFFLQDAHGVANRLRMAKEGSYSIDKSRSALYAERIKNFPMNSEFEAVLTFSGDASGKYLSDVVPSSSSITVREHHSFVQLPDNKYKPRKFDPRAGYYPISYYDYATPFTEPLEQRYITRHRLEKKDPTAAISEPVKPIIYYVDPGAPPAVQKALIEGASWWNQAYEAAGYKNAFRVEILPVGADPMDVRYNVINWVHRATRGWSYGASVTDPRTGEIIKGHVSLGSLRDRQDFLIAEGLLAPYEDGKPLSKDLEEMTLLRLRQLAAHEVGHTLGLSHSYTSSTENNASVMDYPQPVVNLTNGKIDISKAYDSKIGDWDKVAIAFGYQDYPIGTDEEKAGYNIIQNSLKAGLTFLSDQDARPLGSAHPFAHLWDNGKDVADELNRMMEIRSVVLRNFGEKNLRPNTPFAMLEEVLVPMYFYHRYQVEATAKMIGGLNYRYALKGDGQLVTEFISPEQQQKALDALLKTVSPAALMLPENLLKIIPPRPIGYERHREIIQIRTSLTFDDFGLVESAADMTFGLLFQPERANRLVEYHARDAKQPGLDAVIDKVVAGTIKAEKKKGMEGAIQQIVNYALIENLAGLAVDNGTSMSAKAIVFQKLEKLRALTAAPLVGADSEWITHYNYLNRIINSILTAPGEFKKEHLLTPPPGSPIGSDKILCED